MQGNQSQSDQWMVTKLTGLDRAISDPPSFYPQEFLLVFPNKKAQPDSVAFRQAESADVSSDHRPTMKGCKTPPVPLS